jgi:tetraacyldisaccharide 4'-kinase
VVVLRAEDAALEPTLRKYVRQDCRFWRIRRTLRLATPVKHAMAFCAIARPGEFFSALEAAGVEVVERMRFRDHHAYTAADMDRVAAAGKRVGCDAFVMTAKDEVKLDAALRLRLRAVAPVVTAELTVELEDDATLLRELSSLLPV